MRSRLTFFQKRLIADLPILMKRSIHLGNDFKMNKLFPEMISSLKIHLLKGSGDITFLSVKVPCLTNKNLPD